MENKVSYNSNIKKLNLVSYIITTYNKRRYLQKVLKH